MLIHQITQNCFYLTNYVKTHLLHFKETNTEIIIIIIIIIIIRLRV
ncbi:MAG: hypothetical protein J8272_00480 ['Prunus persica' phytoplasma PP2]|nr:hypothetical protein ['Prunus persica' phytoplasma PP2]